MWTKQIDKDGNIFFFNSTQNRSVWQPPADAVIHEAPNLRYQPVPQQDINKNAADAFISDLIGGSSELASNQRGHSPSGVSTIAVPPVEERGISSDTGGNDVIRQKMEEAVQRRQREAMAKLNGKKVDDQSSSTLTSSTYLQQKNELESMAGSKGDDAGKWLVR